MSPVLCTHHNQTDWITHLRGLCFRKLRQPEFTSFLSVTVWLHTDSAAVIYFVNIYMMLSKG